MVKHLGPDQTTEHIYFDIQLRLRLWITNNFQSTGISIAELVLTLLKNAGCWCVHMHWPWLRTKLFEHSIRYLSHLRHLSQHPPTTLNGALQLLRLRYNQCDLVGTRDLGSYAVRATVKQILNTCVACARGLQDFEVSFSSDDEEPSASGV